MHPTSSKIAKSPHNTCTRTWIYTHLGVYKGIIRNDHKGMEMNEMEYNVFN